VVVDERRSGAALVRATKPFSEEIPSLTWRLLFTTLLVYAATVGVAVWAPWWPVQLAGSVLAGFVLVRVFIFYHDYLHGAVFRDSRLGRAVMVAYGWFILAPPPVWEQTHNYHHQNNAKMLGAAIGSYPTVSVRMWHMMSPSQRRWYRFARNPLTILFGYFTSFVGGMCFAAFARDPKAHWQGPAALLIHLGLMAGVGALLGWQAALFGVFVPHFVATALGSYLFYAQHNFPACELRSRESWSYHHAALKASSMFDMPDVLHWLTGNIGYHHVHHLNHKIPFYRLPEAMAALPELQEPGRTSWAPHDIAACLRLKLWDPKQNKLVGWEAVADTARAPADGAPAGGS
jgi:omega-6 fatty acid desaturase (delta-12 desaturase)